MGLMSWLTGETAKPKKPTTNITNVSQIKKIVHHLKEAHQSLDFSFVGISDTYSSIILKIDFDKGIYYVDELVPANGNAAMKQGKTTQVKTYVNGIMTKFKSAVVNSGTDENGTQFHALTIPQEVYYRQRRVYPRVKPPARLSLEASLMLENGLTHCTVKDLGADGSAFLLNGNYTDVVNPGNAISTSVIRITSDLSLSYPLLVKHVRFINNSNQTMIGCQFKDLNNKRKKILINAVNALNQLANKK
ncbi:MAG: hypothetical protein CMF25_04675 [Kangiellaceae bacterium]|jgi:c-di-GMP-binding flagellar brake protein YcgR|nr:hypothetical protein [Kangiellaceae bacterium]|tara:strand:- start:2089 stop:2829 length:741 start_codon:yes stop_codon:yes gene_type:complete